MTKNAALYQFKLRFGFSLVQALFCKEHTAPKGLQWQKANLTHCNPSATTRGEELTRTKFVCLMSEDVCVAFGEKKCPCKPFSRQVAKAKIKTIWFWLSSFLCDLSLGLKPFWRRSSEIITASGSWNALKQSWTFQSWTLTDPHFCEE